ncbi:4-hydroxybenzoate octaprenyltransferase [Blochmannia endosymbiont of Camponotus (Colobopsis) obliquus]|uniref:4-hydroxybenzoate octaprenyltransferase n=1 Tax=Blochmannia endosymbiont of Camponotus (Colobopsis) obliquus TaxID=1505597 RepID=UPI00061A73C5|nr:4-hydroxybenzoate octaprenyltransferase [Blochmannia endosymbiont of Camponotus (Colobopsis) obliquus]AKC60209.1 4-hydroxybenzoate octaprenyltransferase [Blochmannia endosymbiont of Camponotus (Colobopsis) obliquus]
MQINKWYVWIRLARLDQPIGFFLLLWPTLWALWLASNGIPDLDVLVIFVLGVFFMRSAGCIINDYIDKDIDKLVQRTKNRPLLCGVVNCNESIMLFVIFIFISFLLTLMIINRCIFFFSVVALILTCIYPYVKRYCYFPQLVLGVLFSWSIPMVFITVCGSPNKICWLLFLANTIWTISYDTQYAMLDRDDDLCIGIKSTAILFGKYDRFMIGLLQMITWIMFLFIGLQIKSRFIFYIILTMVLVVFVYQQKLIIHFDRDRCFQAFLSNNYVGMLIFIGILFS